MKVKDMRRKIAKLDDEAEIKIAIVQASPEPPKASVIYAWDPASAESVALWVFDGHESPEDAQGHKATAEGIDDLLAAIGCRPITPFSLLQDPDECDNCLPIGSDGVPLK